MANAILNFHFDFPHTSLTMTIIMLNMISSRSGAVVLVTGKQEAGINLGEILERWIFTILLLIIGYFSHDQKKMIE